MGNLSTNNMEFVATESNICELLKPLHFLCQSTGLRPGPGSDRLTWVTVPLCKGGAGVQGFSWPVFSTLSTKPSGGLSPAGRVFSLC